MAALIYIHNVMLFGSAFSLNIPETHPASPGLYLGWDFCLLENEV